MAQVPGSPRRVAFFGGSFDPPHLGHLAVARVARSALRLDTVLFAPVGMQPLKPRGSTAPFEDRVAMTGLAIAGEPRFALTRIDAPNGAGLPNYTLETLEQLHAELPDAELFCLMGADSFVSLKRWHGAAEVPFAASLIVASRPGQSLDDLADSVPAGLVFDRCSAPAQSDPSGIELRTCSLRNAAGRVAEFYILPGLDVEISASEIRAAIRSRNGPEPARPLLPAAVARYIREHELYQ